MRPWRSDKFQYKFAEQPADLSWFSEQRLDSYEDMFTDHHSEYWKYLNDQAASRILDSMKLYLTKIQFDTVDLYSKGYTQQEIAKIRNKNQSTITKTIIGGQFYKNGKVRKSGGAAEIIRINLKKDNILRTILKDMDKIDDNNSETDFYKNIIWPIRLNCNINIFYLVSSLFESNDDFIKWINTDLSQKKLNKQKKSF